MFCPECGNFAARKAIRQLTGGKNGFVCLPVVELSTTIATGATFTDDENAALTAAAENKMPVIIKGNFSIGGATFSDTTVVATYASVMGASMFAASVGSITAEFSDIAGNWSVRLS